MVLAKNKNNSVAFYCYILECADGTFYTGWTTDPERRLKQHNRGIGARYTRVRLPVKLVYLEPQPDRVAAIKRERAIKRLSRDRKKELTLTPILGASPVPLSSPKETPYKEEGS